MPAYALYAYYNGQRYVIQQPRYVIGRSRKTCDIVLNDSNVSRQHAAVEWIGNGFYIVDMGSTNGIEFHGQRVMRKLLHEGDMIRIAGHEIHFSYAR
jgi:pSer/pThr/pTyr-binding forkhead associated (FHA) protein